MFLLRKLLPLLLPSVPFHARFMLFGIMHAFVSFPSMGEQAGHHHQKQAQKQKKKKDSSIFYITRLIFI